MPSIVRRTVFSLARSALLAAATGLLAGCAAPVKVDVDENEDFSQYRTWDWMPEIRPRVGGSYAVMPALDLRMKRLIAEALEARGLVRTDPPADFYVTFQLSVQRKAELMEQPVSPYLLDSHHASPSIWIEGSETVEHRFDEMRVAVGITKGGSRMTWQAFLERRLEPDTILPLEEAVTALFDHFPDQAPPSGSAAKP